MIAAVFRLKHSERNGIVLRVSLSVFCRWLGLGAVVVCIILYLAEFWASVKLKRHTVKEFLAGSSVAGVIFLVVTLLKFKNGF